MLKKLQVSLVCVLITLILFNRGVFTGNSVNRALASADKGEPASNYYLEPLTKYTSISLQTFPALIDSTNKPEWVRLEYPILPPPRIGSSIVMNSINNVIYLFGGINSSTGDLNDFWISNGDVWMQFQTPHSPDARSYASMAYDEEHQTAILFGGKSNALIMGDTWLFNGIDWIQKHSQNSPSPRFNASIAYDPNKKVTVLFGGEALDEEAKTVILNDMWIWDGVNWQQQFLSILPPARSGASMVYDHAHKCIILFGGSSGGGFNDDTWLWDENSWAEHFPLHHPTGRANFGMTYDGNNQQVVLFGGQSYAYADSSETWTWKEGDWEQLYPRESPSKEIAYGAQLFYLPNQGSVMLYNSLRLKSLEPGDEIAYSEQSVVWALAYRKSIYLPIISGR